MSSKKLILPGFSNNYPNKWEKSPSNQIINEISKITFIPHDIKIIFTSQSYEIYQYLKIKNPISWLPGCIQFKNIKFIYQWHSFDGHTPDWISLSSEYSIEFVEFIRELENLFVFQFSKDLFISVTSK